MNCKKKEKQILRGIFFSPKNFEDTMIGCGVRQEKWTGSQNFVNFFKTFFKVDKTGKEKKNLHELFSKAVLKQKDAKTTDSFKKVKCEHTRLAPRMRSNMVHTLTLSPLYTIREQQRNRGKTTKK